MGTTSIDKSNLVVIPIALDYVNRNSTTEPFLTVTFVEKIICWLIPF